MRLVPETAQNRVKDPLLAGLGASRERRPGEMKEKGRDGCPDGAHVGFPPRHLSRIYVCVCVCVYIYTYTHGHTHM